MNPCEFFSKNPFWAETTKGDQKWSKKVFGVYCGIVPLDFSEVGKKIRVSMVHQRFKKANM